LSERGQRKSRIGVVVSDRMNKSVVVEVRARVQHPLYKKYIETRRRLMAHDETNACQIGDRVCIVETRPLSRRKRWRVQEKLA
jgi:small subunit ribosomal protein S17